ncbi:DNA-protecting protein DprA [bacterium]|nr:MAG: DNA-protecting protein DprA [bacterium]
MDPAEKQRIFWHLALTRAPHIGAVTAKTLLERFGDAKSVFRQDRASLGQFIPPSAVNGILAYEPEKDEFIQNEIDLIERENVTIVTPLDKEYPKLLRSIFDPPTVLYVKGKLQPLDDVAVGIVGTRRATRYGIDQARRFAKYLVEQNITVVSGMAMGIDAEAQEAAVKAGGRTIAVLGCGVDVVYPMMHTKLYESIIETGAVISELPMGTQPIGHNFPRRNRIISGISLGVLVIEGGKSSGALITAEFAANQGREVFALPGPVDRPTSDGTNMLIQQGAIPVTEPSQIIQSLGVPELAKEARRKALDIAKGLDGVLKVLFEALDYEPKHIDVIARETNMDTQHVMSTLTELEMRDLIKRLPGMFYARNV